MERGLFNREVIDLSFYFSGSFFEWESENVSSDETREVRDPSR